MRSFTLESGQEEIGRLNQHKKDLADSTDQVTSPARTSRTGSLDSMGSPANVRSPSLANVPEEGGTFAIGDDDETDDEDHEFLPTPSQSSPSNNHSRSPSVSSLIDGTLPMQLRGMSEKARGKMPVGQTQFSRHNSMTSLSSHAASMLSPGGNFEPSAQWVCRNMLLHRLKLGN